MAEETTDKLVKIGEFTNAKECQTDGYILDGGDEWYETLFIRLIQDFGVDVEVRAISLASLLGFPHFFVLRFVFSYITRKRKSVKNREGLGTPIT